LADAGESVASGEELGAREIVLKGLKARLHRLFEVGAIDAADQVAARIRVLAEVLRQPEYLRLATMWDGMIAGTRGRFIAAEQLVARTLTTMEGHPQQVYVQYLQTLPWRWLQGKAKEHLSAVAPAPASGRSPFAMWHAGWACYSGGAEEPADARAYLGRIDGKDLEPETRRFDGWMVVVSMPCVPDRRGWTGPADRLYPLVLPYRTRN